MPTEKADIFTIAKFGDFNRFLQLFNSNDINKKMNGLYSLLHLSISGKNYDIAMFLLKNGIDVNIQDDRGQTALQYACEDHNEEICAEILKRGYDISLRDSYGNNALWTAVFNCGGKYYDIVKLILKYAPDKEGKNNAGRSPIDLAKQFNDKKLIDLLS